MSPTTSPSPAPVLTAFRLAWPVALLVLGSVMTAAAWHRLTVSLLFALVAALPLLLLRAAMRLGVSRWAASSMLVLLIVMGAYLMTSGAGLSLSHTVTDSVPRLLTAPLPYVPEADLLVGPLLLTALVSLLVGLRVDGGTRVVPVAGGAVLYVAGALLTAGSADPWGLVAVLMLAVALLGWVFLDEHSEPVSARLAIAAPLTVLGVGALAALATVPLQQPFQPRDLVVAPTVQVVSTNPLSQLGAWAHNPGTPLLRVRGDDVPLRLVVLDQYDGQQWTASTSYAQVGTDGRTDLTTGPYARAASVQVEFAGLGGSWLPSPGTPSAVGAHDALVDPGTGTLLTQQSTTGLDYDVSGSYDDPPDQALESAQVAEGPLYDHYTQLPPLPEPLAEYATRVAADAVTPYQRAVTISQQIRHDYTFAPTAISGTALWRLQDFLLGSTSQPGGQEGTSEQFAAAFAVVARYNGLPTRVVVGFRPGEDQPDGTRLVTGSDALAWAEVYFQGLGWVPFSPTPDDDTFGSHRSVEAQQAHLPDPADTGSVPTVADSTPGTPGASLPRATEPGSSSGPPPWTPYAGGAASLILVVAALAGLRWLRRRRHARSGPVGAWLEVLDALRLAGLRPPPHQSAEQIATAADDRFGIAATTRVASAAEQAAFAPTPGPTSGPTPGPTSADGLVRHVNAVRRSARETLPAWRRWWWYLDPRILR